MCPKVMDLYYASRQRVKRNKIKSYGGKKNRWFLYIWHVSINTVINMMAKSWRL